MAASDDASVTDTVTVWSKDGIPWPTEITLAIAGSHGAERWEGLVIDMRGAGDPHAGVVTVHLSDGRRARAIFTPERDPQIVGVEPFHRPDGLAV